MLAQRSPTHRRYSASATFRTFPSHQSTTTTTMRMCWRLLSAASCCCYCCWCLSRAFECFAADTSDTVSAAVQHLIHSQMLPKLKIKSIAWDLNLPGQRCVNVRSLPLTLLLSLVPLIVLELELYRWLTRFDGVLIWGKIVNGVMGWDRWYFCKICCWLWSFSFNWSRLCFISDEAEVDDVMMNVEEELLGWSHSCWTASSGVIRFLGSHLKGKERR